MRTLILIFFLPAVFLFACNSGNKDADHGKASHTAEEDVQAVRLPNRDVLIRKIQELKALIESRDKMKIAAIIKFPIQPNFGVEDSLLKDGKLTRKAFYDHFDEFSDNYTLQDLTYVIDQLKIDSLKFKDEIIKYQDVPASEPCQSYCRMAIANDTLHMELMSAGNVSYAGDDAADEACESNFIWEFIYDGERLRLVYQLMAG